MENTSLVGLSRQVTLRRELDVIANNLANLTTTGFKSERMLFEEYLMPAARDDNFAGNGRRLSFVQDRTTLHDMRAGTLKTTGNQLDFAIDGDAFFAVQTPDGERYQRSGSFEINSNGELVTREGFQVLGDAGPIRFEQSDTTITAGPDGTLSSQLGRRGKLKLARFDKPSSLSKDGVSTWRSSDTALPATTGTRIIQGALEQSNVQAVVELTRMMEVQRAYTNLSNVLQSTGDLRRDAIRTLSEVQA